MVSEYTLHRAEELARSIQVLRETLARRFAPDEVVDSRVDDLEISAAMLLRELKKEK